MVTQTDIKNIEYVEWIFGKVFQNKTVYRKNKKINRFSFVKRSSAIINWGDWSIR